MASTSARYADLSKIAAPYIGFAQLYDALLGDPMFPLVRRNFEWLVRRYGVRFRSSTSG
ncbi:hypothetical protein HYR99_16190 [Candidatus Poribacteria bacterium]|nr:hypothetical protein [Candidatus Poribacteria bacterium]